MHPNEPIRIPAGLLGIIAKCLVMLLTAIAGATGCASTSKITPEKLPYGFVYYCDGAGGGGITKWSGGLRSGLVEGGYRGTGRLFPWNTGLGVVADQNASVSYKRSKARKMAEEAAKYQEEYPDGPVTFIGLSAGTAVVVFGLEEMPPGKTVDNVVLCGASISSTYDLTRALQNVDGRMYVFTSESDPVLGFLVPMAGTADRASGSVPSAGLHGFRTPASASAETRSQYKKLVTIPWRPEFAKLGYHGGHTDVLSRHFVAAEIAPRLTKRLGEAPPQLASTQGKVRNPDYERLRRYGVGTYAILEGYQVYRGERTNLRMKWTMTDKSADRLMSEREFFLEGTRADTPDRIHSLIAEAWIDPRQHPTTDPAATVKKLSPKTLSIKGRNVTCEGRSIEADGDYPQWGSQVKATVYRSPDVPGMAELTLETHFGGELFRFYGRLVDFHIVPDSASR